jgi:hypothetical protein
MPRASEHWTRRLWGSVEAGIAHFTKAAKRARTSGESLIAGLLTSGGTYAYPNAWTHDKYEQIRRFRGWQYVAIRVIAEELAMNRPQVGFIRKPEQLTKSLIKSGRIVPKYMRTKAVSNTIQNHEAIEAADSDDPLRRLLNNPNRPDTCYTMFYRTGVFLELTGEAYWLKIRNGFGEVIELWPLFPHWVTPRASAERLVDHYEIRPFGYGSGGVGIQQVAPEDVVSFLYPSPLTMTNGHAPVGACGEWVDVNDAIEASQWYAFENGNHPGVIFELDPDTYAKGKTFDESVLDRFYARFDAKHGGREKHRRPLVVNPGMTAKPWSNSPAEMDYTDSSDSSRDRILAINRVSKTIAGMTDDVKYDNLAGATANFIERTMAPKHCFIGEIVTEQLARMEFGEDYLVYYVSAAKPTPQQLNEDIRVDQANGSITPNEQRALRGREPFEFGGNNPLIGGIEMPWAEQLPEDESQDWSAQDETAEPDQFEDVWYSETNADKAMRGRFDESKVRRGQPDNAGKFGPGGGGSKPSNGRAAQSGHSDRMPSHEGNRHEGKQPPTLPFKQPPEPKGKSGGKAGGWSSIKGMTNTSLGDMAEQAVSQFGLRSLLPEGKRQNPLDMEYDHSGYAFEVKACSVTATEYKAKPKAKEVAEKVAYAKKHKLKPATMIAVVDVANGQIHAYWRPGIGAYKLTQSGENWHYMGTVSIKKQSLSRNGAA